MDVTDTGPATRLADYRTLADATLSAGANATEQEIELAIALRVMLGLYEREIAAHQRSVDYLQDKWADEYHRLKARLHEQTGNFGTPEIPGGLRPDLSKFPTEVTHAQE